MHSFSVATVLAVAASLTTSASAAFNAKSKTNVVTYWGQGANQDRLLVTCHNPSYDIINIGFVDVFPDQGAGGWPGTNFGNACWGDVYQNKGVNTSLLKTCPDIGPDVIACQQTYGKKIFLSIGGGYPTNYYIKNAVSGQNFAKFLWAAFGPVSASKANVPRPWGDAGVDGFDFDIENLMDPAPQSNYQTSGYAAMINYFKNKLFPQDTTKSYYISGAPQCPIPDSHLSVVLAASWFDFFWIQFYNTPQCSARAAIQKANGKGVNDITYAKWTTQSSKNPNVKMLIGIPGSKTAAIDPSYYLTPGEAQQLVTRFYRNAKFGGLMIWEATAAQNQTPCGVDYGTWMKDILNAKAAGTTFNTNTQTCAAFPSKRSIPEPAVEDVALVRRGEDYTVSYCTETATHVHGGSTSYETYQATHTIFPTMPNGYYIPSESAAIASSSAWAYQSSAPSSAVLSPPAYGSASSSAPGLTYTSLNTVTIMASGPASSTSAAWGAPTAPASYPYGPSGGNGTSWGTASASAAWPSSSGWVAPATGGAASQGFSVFFIMAAGALALMFA